MPLLKEMLSYKRGAGTVTEEAFIARFLDTVPEMQRDAPGNRFLLIGDHPTTLFSAHTDSVHLAAGRQSVREDRRERILFKEDGEPLGADDATGCWILLELIARRVPGLYLFHREEECGGNGSSWVAWHDAARLRDIQRAIAFDRRGTTDVITHQSGSRCCSDHFAEALATQLGHNFAPCDTGVFTDTLNYIDLVPECTNISIGYEHAHSEEEYQDLGYLEALIPALLAVAWDTLPVVRECAPDPDPEVRYLMLLVRGGRLGARQGRGWLADPTSCVRLKFLIPYSDFVSLSGQKVIDLSDHRGHRDAPYVG